MNSVISAVKSNILELSINIITSGKYKKTDDFGMSDYLMRYVMMNFTSILGSLILAGFAFENIIQERHISAIACFGMMFICIATILIARTKIRQRYPALMLVIFYALLCLMVTFSGEAEGANFLFIYIYPPITIMILGLYWGITYSLILITLISLEMFVPNLSIFNYHFDFSIRMLASYILLVCTIITIELTRRTKDRLIEVQKRKLQTLSTTDELTKLNNRRSFMNYMEIIWKQSHRLNLPITVLMIDVDFFKRYNDSLGHLAGDKALISIAQCMKYQLKRETDFVARYGGEEFVCLIPYVENTEAINFANRLVKSVEEMELPHPTSEHSKYITISAGMASLIPNENNTWKELLDDADKALYKAKQTGRNRVAVYS